MQTPDIVWGVWLLLFVVFEGVALVSHRAGDTLSERTRAWFAVHTKAGRITFGVVWVGFSAWFGLHILWG